MSTQDENATFQSMGTVAPDYERKFRASMVQPIVKEVLEKLRPLKYHPDTCATLSKQFAIEIRDRIKELSFFRYKVFVHVVFGELKGQGVRMANRSFWSSENDSCAVESFKNVNLLSFPETHGIAMTDKKNPLSVLPTLDANIFKINSYKVNTAWIEQLRVAKVDELKKKVAQLSESFYRDLRRFSRQTDDLETDILEATKQEKAIESNSLDQLNILAQVFQSASKNMVDRFNQEFNEMAASFEKEQTELKEMHEFEVTKLQSIIAEITRTEAAKDGLLNKQRDDYLETVKNRSIEEVHEMRQKMNQKIASLRDKCTSQLSSYKQSTEQASAEYRTLLMKDAELAKQVHALNKEVDEVQSDMMDLKIKLGSSKEDWEHRNTKLAHEKEALQKHISSLKIQMNLQHKDDQQKLVDLSNNAQFVKTRLQNQISLANNIISTFRAAKNLRTLKEDSQPFLEIPSQSADNIENPDDPEHSQESVDETTIFSNYFQTMNRVKVDCMALEAKRREFLELNERLKMAAKKFHDEQTIKPNAVDDKKNNLLKISKINFSEISTNSPTKKLTYFNPVAFKPKRILIQDPKDIADCPKDDDDHDGE